MPATRPTNADPKPKHDEDTNIIDHSGTPFSIHFDKLVIAVGAYSQSDYLRSFFFSFLNGWNLPAAFNVPGVKEHAHFLKDVKDARRIRGRILECPWISPNYHKSSNASAGFEQANQPFLTDIERRHLLNFCVVGMVLYLGDRTRMLIQALRWWSNGCWIFGWIIRPSPLRHCQTLSGTC